MLFHVLCKMTQKGFIVMASHSPPYKKQWENAITHPQSHPISTYEWDGTEDE